MIDSEHCSRCGAGVTSYESCAACLLAAAMDEVKPPDLNDTLIGPYRLGGLLGAGGVGLVYEAVDTRSRSIRPGQKVALKILAADVDAPDQLLREAQLAAALEHEHILPVYEVGDHEGIAYFTMKRVEGGRLKTPAASPREAAELALKIARAVRFAHRHGILHRDLKPANVLVDSEGRPFVTDFGLAEREELADGKVRAGTPEHMAPEMWEAKPASTVADVWGAGTILYELLTGHPPFEASLLEQLQQIIAKDPPPALVNVPSDLAAICLRCLEKEPSRRYASAHELVNDLERFLANEPVHARPLGAAARWWRWATRHPVIAVLSTLLCTVAIGAILVWFRGASAQRAAVDAADFAARYVAQSTSSKFEEYNAAVEQAGQNPDVARAIAEPSMAQQVCDELRERYAASAFSNWDLFDTAGTLVARSPRAPRDNRGRSYKFRDYFRGAAELENQHLRRTFVSGVYRSEGDDNFAMAISVPVHDEANGWVGVLTGALSTGSALGSIRLPDTRNDHLTAALLAPRDREREWAAGGSEPEPIIILHPSLKRGEIRQAGDLLSNELGAGGFVRVVHVEGTPLSVLVRVAFDERPAVGR